jgi:hypothetical protein
MNANGPREITQAERTFVDEDLAAVAEGLRRDLTQAPDDATRLIIASGLTVVEGCRQAVATAQDSKAVERHLRTLRDVLSRMDETVARYRARLEIPGKGGSDAIN